MTAPNKPYNASQDLHDTANTFICHDATGTPVVSPLSSTADLIVPATAVALVVSCRTGSTNAVDVAVKSTSETGTFRLTAGQKERFPIAGLGAPDYPSTITLTLGASTYADFFFECLSAWGA